MLAFLHFCVMKVELCVASVEALQAAKSMGFDRIELCINLEQGGLTPSLGMVELAMEMNLDTHVLIRPRIGGFVYQENEIDLIFREVKSMERIGVQGVVVGALTENIRLNRVVLKEIRKIFPREITIHRAFDDLIEWKPELSWLMENNFNRVLTSGLATSIQLGIPVLKEMKQFAGTAIEIMAGGGIHLANLELIIQTASPDAIHFSGTNKALVEPDSMFSENRLIFDNIKAKKLLDVCRNFSK